MRHKCSVLRVLSAEPYHFFVIRSGKTVVSEEFGKLLWAKNSENCCERRIRKTVVSEEFGKLLWVKNSERVWPFKYRDLYDAFLSRNFLPRTHPLRLQMMIEQWTSLLFLLFYIRCILQATDRCFLATRQHLSLFIRMFYVLMHYCCLLFRLSMVAESEHA